MIYDCFRTRDAAEQFCLYVRRRTGLAAMLYMSQAESDALDPFPFELAPPIVIVAGPDAYEFEDLLERRATYYGGQYAGT